MALAVAIHLLLFCIFNLNLDIKENYYPYVTLKYQTDLSTIENLLLQGDHLTGTQHDSVATLSVCPMTPLYHHQSRRVTMTQESSHYPLL